MRQVCEKCGRRYDDEFSWTICPHNPLEAGPSPEDYCRRHDFCGPCPICKMTAEVKGREGRPEGHAVVSGEGMSEMVTIYSIRSKYGNGYWTTDKAMVDEEVRVDIEDNDSAMGFFVEERQVSREEFERMERESEGREFPGW